MNYQRIYDKLIFRAICRQDSPSKLTGYTEKHHVVPKSMGGSNKKVNLVALTPREHYIAHHLLYKIHRNSSMAHAWFMMCTMKSDNQERYDVKSWQYESARKAHSERLIGKKSWNKGKNHSEEHKLKLKKAWEQRKVSGEDFSHSEETKKKISESNKGKNVGQVAWNKGKPASEETKYKLSEINKGRTPWNKGKPMSEESKDKLSSAKKGKPAHNKGKSLPDETKKKISETMLLSNKLKRGEI